MLLEQNGEDLENPLFEANRQVIETSNRILANRSLEVIYDGPFSDAGGYAKMNREVVRQLDHLGVNVRTKIFRANRNGLCTVDIRDIETMQNTPLNTRPPCIFGSVTQNVMPTQGSHNIAYTMMETENLDGKFVQKCNFHDAIMVPCQWNVDVFKANGIVKPIYKIPLGINTNIWNSNVQPLRFAPQLQGKFIFLSVFGWSLRKGYDILLDSFLSAFKNNKNVALVIFAKIWGSESQDHQNMIQNEINKYLLKHGVTENNVFHIGTGLPEEQLPSLYKACDCFVLPTRGEGFCTLPDAYIKTPSGVEEIKNMNVGDDVFTHTGEIRPITHIFKREYSGKLLKIFCYGRSNIPVALTPNHLVRVIRTSSLSSKTCSKYFKHIRYDIQRDTLYMEKLTDHHNSKIHMIIERLDKIIALFEANSMRHQ